MTCRVEEDDLKSRFYEMVIVTPKYEANSNGVLLLFKLGQVLARLGQRVAYHPQSLEDYDYYPHLLMEGTM